MFNDLFSASLCGHCFTLFLFWLFIYESASSFYIDLDRTTVAYTLLSFRFHSGRLGSRTRALHIACLCIAYLCHAFHCPSPSLTMDFMEGISMCGKFAKCDPKYLTMISFNT